ncbi:ATP-binding protein [Thermodesulfobacteriota bacterium]
MEPNQIFSILGTRAGISDDRYFVGRSQHLSSLSICYYNQSRRSSAWLYGSRRIGKTSLADVLAKKAENNGTTVIRVDAIDLTENHFENLLIRTLEKAKSFVTNNQKSIKENFEQLVKTSKDNPLLIIFDEMDKIAINLKIQDQAFLRRLDSDNERFCYCFISCLPPETIVEEVPEINSRLLGICEPHKIGPLMKGDVRLICKKVGSDLKIDYFEEFHQEIWKKVGGFPIAVNSLIKSLAIFCYHNSAVNRDEVSDILESKYEELKIDFRSLLNSLNTVSRLVLKGEIPAKDNEHYLREDGYYSRITGVIRPEFLVRVGKEETQNMVPPTQNIGTTPEMFNLINNLVQLIPEINYRLKLKGYKDGFYLASETISHSQYCTETCSEGEFDNILSSLYKAFFEGAKDRKPTKTGEKLYRLPEPLASKYKNSDVIGTISNLRNFRLHECGQATDPEKPNKDFIEAGEIFRKYCGCEVPHNDALRIVIRNRIIKELVELLQSLNEDILSLS